MKKQLLMILIACGALIGCVGMGMTGKSSTQSTSLVEYLYPADAPPPTASQTVPHLQIPLRVGLAFVPPATGSAAPMSAAMQQNLLNQVKKAFEQQAFITDIQVIPSQYMTAKGGLDSLSQLGRLYHIDVLALVSYDQQIYTDENASTILYWTILGAYLVDGTENEIQTFVDTAVIDIKTHSLILRAAGISQVENKSAIMRQSAETRALSDEGFRLATQDGIKNLSTELELLKENIKNNQADNLTVSYKEGYAGAMDLFSLLVALGLISVVAVRRKIISRD